VEITSSISRLAADNLNQYPSVGGTAFGYDGQGNMTYDGTFTYAFDAENRLLTASKTGVAAAYAYDPLGRRTRKSGTGVTARNSGDTILNEFREFLGQYI